MDGLHIKSPGTVNWYVNELEQAGVLERSKGYSGKRALILNPVIISDDITIPFFESSVAAGIPALADDHVAMRLNLNQHLVKNPTTTFSVRVKGDSMMGATIYDGDLLIVDRSLVPKDSDIAICIVDGEFTVKRLQLQDGTILLLPENPDYPPIAIDESNDFQIWGIVTHVIHQSR
jgi:DNA polymerase V